MRKVGRQTAIYTMSLRLRGDELLALRELSGHWGCSLNQAARRALITTAREQAANTHRKGRKS